MKKQLKWRNKRRNKFFDARLRRQKDAVVLDYAFPTWSWRQTGKNIRRGKFFKCKITIMYVLLSFWLRLQSVAGRCVSYLRQVMKKQLQKNRQVSLMWGSVRFHQIGVAIVDVEFSTLSRYQVNMCG